MKVNKKMPLTQVEFQTMKPSNRLSILAESKWEAPEEGYLSIEEQEKLSTKTGKGSENTTSASASLPCGPVQKAEAFSSWKRVEKYEAYFFLPLKLSQNVILIDM